MSEGGNVNRFAMTVLIVSTLLNTFVSWSVFSQSTQNSAELAIVVSKLSTPPREVRQDILEEIIKLQSKIEIADQHNYDERVRMEHELRRDRWTYEDQKSFAKQLKEKLDAAGIETPNVEEVKGQK